GRVTFFDNHDMNRFLFLANGDTRRLKLATLCLLTLPFPPVLYYGTEIGLSQNQDKDAGGLSGDHEVRHDMIWDPALWDHDLLAFFRAIIGLRRQQPVLRRGKWHPLYTDLERQIYGYKIVSGSFELQVLFNLSDVSHQIPLDPPQPRQMLLSTNSRNALQDADAERTLTLEGLSGVVLASKRSQSM
ncbi:MAG: alpha-amylase family glycosyl hydrolase, partial [Anaerolineae bacterium]